MAAIASNSQDVKRRAGLFWKPFGPPSPGHEKLQPSGMVLRFLHLLSFLSVLAWFLWAAPLFPQLEDTSGQHVYDGAPTILEWPLAELTKALPELQGLDPAQSQKELPRILDKLGKTLTELLESLPNTCSREDLTQEELDRDGRVKAQRFQSFTYLTLARRGEGKVDLQEYRTDAHGSVVGPQGTEDVFSLTSGFASMWAHFYPSNRIASRFSLLGEQELKGHKAYVIAFAQRPGWATVVGKAVADGKSALILYQGVAWIDVVSYQIVRLRTELLAPLKSLHIERQSTEIEFGEVRFPLVSSLLWLPREVVVTTESKGLRILRKGPDGGLYIRHGQVLRNEHRYSDYRLFGAQSTIKPVEGDEKNPQKPH